MARTVTCITDAIGLYESICDAGHSAKKFWFPKRYHSQTGRQHSPVWHGEQFDLRDAMPLNKRTISAGENFGGALSNRCTWSGTLAPHASAGVTSTAMISNPYCVVISTKRSFNLASTDPTKTFLR